MLFSAIHDALKSHKLLRLSKQFSMCKIEKAACGAKLHHPWDRVKCVVSECLRSNFMIGERRKTASRRNSVEPTKKILIAFCKSVYVVCKGCMLLSFSLG